VLGLRGFRFFIILFRVFAGLGRVFLWVVILQGNFEVRTLWLHGRMRRRGAWDGCGGVNRRWAAGGMCLGATGGVFSMRGLKLHAEKGLDKFFRFLCPEASGFEIDFLLTDTTQCSFVKSCSYLKVNFAFSFVVLVNFQSSYKTQE